MVGDSKLHVFCDFGSRLIRGFGFVFMVWGWGIVLRSLEVEISMHAYTLSWMVKNSSFISG